MRDLSELTTKMKANLKKMADDDLHSAVLHVGAAEHLLIRGLIRKLNPVPGSTAQGVGRAKALYRLTPDGKQALAKI